ncbi:MAG: DUF87 domain-containing protein, partial [Firmicutes bacterium]|nr:DUF87 domain-containing protein [Bacillota bacterium]
MAVRLIPKKTRVKMEFFRGVTLNDVLWLVTGFALIILTIQTVFTMPFLNIYIAIGIGAIFGIGFIRVNDEIRFYQGSVLFFKYLAYRKKFSKVPKGGFVDVKQLIPYEGITDEIFIDYKTYAACVIEIMPVEFGLLGENKQNMLINVIANSFRRLNNEQSASLIHVDRAMILDAYVKNEIDKYNKMIENVERGSLSNEEAEMREIIFEDRVAVLEYLNKNAKVYKQTYYLVIYDKDRKVLRDTTNGIASTILGSPVKMDCRVLKNTDLVVFLRANYDRYFDEREVANRDVEKEKKKILNWITPNKVIFKAGKSEINGHMRTNYTIMDYPLEVGNGWGYRLFNMPGTKTVMNFRPIPRMNAERMIDKTIVEMNVQSEYSARASFQIEKQTHLDTLKELLVSLKTGNEQLFDVTLHVSCDFADRKEVRATFREEGYKYSDLFGRQSDGFISQNVSQLDKLREWQRGISTTTLAACFPFISDMLQDENGMCIGENSYPVLIDFFKRNNERVNSNMIIIGKSGSGKSFASKVVLANLAAGNSKLFICDPEREYIYLTQNLHGTIIDVGTATKGRFNPFHIYPSLVDEEEAVGDDTFESHLRFLESFFRIVLEGIRPDALEALNSLVSQMYREKKINKDSDFYKLRPEQFPIFEDLYEICKKAHKTAKDDFERVNFRILVTYIEKFATGGRFSGLWNGPATIKTDENIVNFDFLTLLSNRNTIVANAQMLLVFKYLDGEIIKNRDYNRINKTERKIIVAVDEAHVFIDEKRPIALDFMFQMAKRIRKYSGMQIIITQNIKDFVGSPLIAKKSA